MTSLLGVAGASLIMGLSIYLSLPIVMRKKTSEKTTRFLNAIAIGILVFLIADIFSYVAPNLYTGGLYGYGANLTLGVIFAVSLAVGFFLLYHFEDRTPKGLSPIKMSFMIATGIGLQNLAEGLVFGSLAVNLGLYSPSLGLSGVALVVLIGFIIQNITEGFPIASPFINRGDKRWGVILALFLLGGLPTFFGGIIGYTYNSTAFEVMFDGLAIGAIVYVILPMVKHQLREIDNSKQRITYVGIFLGFLIGFLVNII
jgi:ZIP family zinc transporter